MPDNRVYSTHTNGNYLLQSQSLGKLFLPLVLGTITCDLLGLIHLLPVHSQHLWRPYMLSGAQFKFKKIPQMSQK
ncbi:uncharacterized protein LOC142232433 [Haematobia irritans]|uniref:uncharacterized protein LOC142232433 n=1 Tax=Haematobia irritans TaxID=7368 RepID=UPI003F4FEA20